jgi:CRP/FNR family transcriptional regulator, cyclic AMP receptor protein
MSANKEVIAMQTIKFNAGDTILSEGEDGDTAFLIVAGSVEVSVGEGAKAKSVATLDAGHVFGEMSLIEPGPRSATVKAVTDTECFVTTYDEFIASIQANPERAVEFMKTLVRRLRQMNERMARMNPGRRGLRDVLRDWQESFELGDGKAIEQGDKERLSMMYWPMM